MVDEASAFGISNFGKKIIDASRGHTRRGYANNQKSGQFWVRTPEPRNLMKSSGNQQNQKAMSGVLDSHQHGVQAGRRNGPGQRVDSYW